MKVELIRPIIIRSHYRVLVDKARSFIDINCNAKVMGSNPVEGSEIVLGFSPANY